MGKIMIVGLGPGTREGMTLEAEQALLRAECIIGYSLYVDLLRPLYPDKSYFTTPMRREEERCRLCFEKAREGLLTALVCSGDPGVYGMAGLMLELAPSYPDVELEILPGVSAALSGAARLGAPLGHDFCCISLSDLLTPWETIERRLTAAAEGDFCIALYNPGSHHRRDGLKRACEILLRFRDPLTPCGMVRNIGREGEEKRLLPLQELYETEADMLTTVFIGNSQSRFIGEALVTPRGYRHE